MNRRRITKGHVLAAIAVGTAVAAITLPALAWNQIVFWHSRNHDSRGGGSGIYGTGSQTDFGILCTHCHDKSPGKVDATVGFAPALLGAAGAEKYLPGQAYQVTVDLVGEHLGIGKAGNYNAMVATFEDAGGRIAGTMAADSTGSSTNCPANAPADPNVAPYDTKTTIMYGDCHGVLPIFNGPAHNRTRWTFTWTAPAAGRGTVTMYYGLTDGDGDETSDGDDNKLGTKKLTEGP
jgi:hypothetical protein